MQTKVKTQPAQTIRMVPICSEALPSVLQWAEAADNAAFFRRFPPLQDWSTPEVAAQLLQGFYLIAVEDTFVGLVSFYNNDSYGKSIEYSMLVNKESVSDRRVVSKNITDQIEAYVFDYMQYNKVSCKVLAHRVGLVKSLEDVLNYKQEGHFKQSIYFKGQWVDEVLLAKLREDY